MMSYKNKLKILVTGVGMIGSNLVKNLLVMANVFVADNLWRGKKNICFLIKIKC